MASLNQNTAILGNKNAKHLLRRATFKYTKTSPRFIDNKQPSNTGFAK